MTSNKVLQAAKGDKGKRQTQRVAVTDRNLWGQSNSLGTTIAILSKLDLTKLLTFFVRGKGGGKGGRRDLVAQDAHGFCAWNFVVRYPSFNQKNKYE